MSVVVVGQGYVGLPVAQGAVRAGHSVRGLDLDDGKVMSLNAGRSVVDDLSDSDVRTMLDAGYRATSDAAVYSSADVIVVCVPTPLKEGRTPDLSAMHNAARDIAQHVTAGSLVILESTTYPGTTETEIAPILESAGFEIGKDMYLAFSPERIDPGNAQYTITNTPKVVGADDAESLKRAVDFYATFIDEVVSVSGTAEAELTKLLENTYRHINIGLVNELAIVCNELGIDVWEVIRAAKTKPFGFQAFYPGPGVGGHCIPIDPNYLNHRVRQALGRPFRFVELAEDVNSSMPTYVVQRIQDILNEDSKALKGSTVLVLGVTYKQGIADTRESPANPLFDALEARGARVEFYDTLVTTWRVSPDRELERVADLQAAAAAADVVVQLQLGSDYDVDALAQVARVLDTRGSSDSPQVIRL